jgi:predicted MFS family arabinose efflux permease
VPKPLSLSKGRSRRTHDLPASGFDPIMNHAATRGGGGWRASLAAMCALLIGIGLARFSYTPLIPALVAAHWLTPGDAAYLGAVNLVGYLTGALTARRAASRVALAPLLRAMMGLATLSFFVCAVPLGFAWFAPWRFLAGFAGAILMVLAPPSALAQVTPEQRGFAGGVIFTGVGLGIAASGLVVPLFLRGGVSVAWCGLGALALLLSAAAWHGFPEAPVRPAQPQSAAPPASRGLRALYAEYALNAVGLVPHMIFLADFVARGLGQGVAAGARQWVIFGIGAVGGPVVLGRIADRIGFAASVRLAYVVQAALIGALAVTAHPVVLALSSLVIGAYVPGITTLVLGRARELVPGDTRQLDRAWSIATASFAIGQAAGAWGLSALFAQQESYAALYALGAGAVVLALAINLVAAR